MKLSRTVAYAVQSILQLAAAPAGSPVACGQLAATGRMPERFLLQILRKLVRSGVLKSHRGVDGGYVLARPIEEISILDIFEAFDNPMVPSVPPLEGLTSEARTQLLDALNRGYSSVRSELASLKMSDLQAHSEPDLVPPEIELAPESEIATESEPTVMPEPGATPNQP